MDKLLADRLKALWEAVDEKRLTVEAFTAEQERLLAEYQKSWEQALRLDAYGNLRESILAELGMYFGCDDLTEIERRCANAVNSLKAEWERTVTPGDRKAIEEFYDQSQTTIYELMWWHSLTEDTSPLAYVMALQLARQRGCRRYLDFGSGVGSGGILFGQNGFDVMLADISSTLLGFCEWRFARRRLPARYVDLKSHRLPRGSVDFVTAMDVFEHLADPVGGVGELWEALEPGGLLYARIAAEPDEDRPQHIVQDFRPTLDRLATLGFVEIWQDAWLWGHRVFEKPMR
jgi:2-polyprenyl-3-methyl-5-hydroxy-6-metoxy-1,4-benzoquinol methylase